MKPSLLTQLGCLGSVAFVLSLGSAAHAADTNSIRSVVFTASQPSTLSVAQNESILGQNDSIEQKAIAKYGCDCPACINRVLQSIQQL
jgi:hypothetical protein